MILLISPPVSKPVEPPAGLAYLSSALAEAGVAHRTFDANLEALLALLETAPLPALQNDTRTTRALRARHHHLKDLRLSSLYRSPARHRRAVSDLNHLLELSGRSCGVRMNLADYADSSLLPLRTADLLRAAEASMATPLAAFLESRLSTILADNSPDIVGLSLNYLSQALNAFSLVGFFRRRAPRVRILLGGGLVTSWSSRMGEKNPFAGLVDAWIPGPGEQALLDFAGAKTPDRLPTCPDYSGFPLDSYLAPGRILPYAASRGCYWRRCRFCPETAERSAWQPVPPDEVIQDMFRLRERHAPTLIHFLDNALSPALLSALARQGASVPWYGFARVTPELADPDFCLRLRASGCRMLQLGIESGSQAVLEALDKGISVSLAGKVLKTLKAAGIGTYVYLLFGTPPEGEEEARQTLDFTVRHADAIDFLNLALFNRPVLDGESQGDERPFYDGDLTLYRDFDHPRGWHRATVRRFLEGTFKRHPAVAPIVRRTPATLTSNVAPFFLAGGASRPGA